jgi:uncharacterized protein (TIGR01244 family)
MTPILRCASFVAATLWALGAIAAPNPVPWREGLTSSGQPDRDALSRLAEQQVGMVINLAPPQSDGSIADEGALVARQGVAYVNIPVDFRKPTQADFELFSAVMRAAADRKVLVHCQVNLRGSAFVFLYRVIHEGVSADNAADSLLGVWTPNPVWRQFIRETLDRHGKSAERLWF